MDSVWADVRHALRTFRANPGLTAVAVLSLAIGIGPNSAMFSLVDGLGLRPLPIRDAARLVLVGSATRMQPSDNCSVPEFRELKRSTRSFSELTASTPIGVGVSGGDEAPAVVFGSLVPDNYFSTLGVDPILGRGFLPEEDRPGGPHVVVISERLWVRRFDRDPRILHRTVRLNQTDCQIVGVLPARFVGTRPLLASEFWVPTSLHTVLVPGSTLLEERDRRTTSIYGRLRPGTTIGQARTEIETLGAHLGETSAETSRDRRLTVEYEEAARRTPFARLAAVSLAVVGLVLLIACANVAGLLLGRSEARRAEIGVRLALGASRGRIVRQLLTESAVLSLFGGAAGLLFAFWFITLLPALMPASPITLNLDFRLDLRVLVFTLAAALLAAPVFGLTPALLASRPNLAPVLKGAAGAANAGRRRLRLRPVLIVGQIAVSLVLLVAAGLLVRSYVNTREIEPGFTPRPMAFCTLGPPAIGYNNSQTHEFYQQLLVRLSAAPGVERASMAAHIPLNALYGGGARQTVAVPGREPPPGQAGESVRFNVVARGYFDTMGVRLLRGRDFDATDRTGSLPVVVVNQTMARRFWPNADPVGQRLTLLAEKGGGQPRECQVVGVARDAKYNSLKEPPEPYLYLPYEQSSRGEMTVVVRGREERALASVLRQTVASLDRTMPMMQVMTLSEHLRLAVLLEQTLAGGAIVVGGVALFLSVIGLYGVIAFFITRRTREIGIRMALGARPVDVVADVLKQGARFAAIGAAVGVALAVLAGHVVRGALYGVSAFDPLTFAAVIVIVMVVTLLAAYVPARRAARIDPIVALRYE